MSFFGKLLGFKKKTESKGYVLGGESDVTEPLVQEEVYEFEVQFHESTLGCKLAKGTDQGSYVFQVDPGTPADIGGVIRSDRVVAVEGNQVLSHEVLLESLRGLPRPITVT